MCARVELCARLRRKQGSSGFSFEKKEGGREGIGTFSKLSSLEAENTRDRKWIRRSLQVLFHEVCLFSPHVAVRCLVAVVCVVKKHFVQCVGSMEEVALVICYTGKQR